jgi:8-oxo-dGTP pyrophosphatase MutT (NUDIX family)
MAHAAPLADKGQRRGNQQVAALPWRRLADGAVSVLLITSRETHRWVIPKGWPMPGRSDPMAAAQEAYEEAGVVGEAEPQPIGDYGYGKRLRGGRLHGVRVQVYALEVFVEQPTWPEQGQRDKMWTSPAVAALLVDEPELRALIAGFAPS